MAPKRHFSRKWDRSNLFVFSRKPDFGTTPLIVSGIGPRAPARAQQKWPLVGGWRLSSAAIVGPPFCPLFEGCSRNGTFQENGIDQICSFFQENPISGPPPNCERDWPSGARARPAEVASCGRAATKLAAIIGPPFCPLFEGWPRNATFQENGIDRLFSFFQENLISGPPP